MSRNSRLPHPPGGRFVQIHVHLLREFGLAGAAVIGWLDFLDQGMSEPEQPLASRARLIADLEGIVGRNSIDLALRELEQRDLLRKHATVSFGARNLERRVEYRFHLAGFHALFGIAGTLATPDSGSFGGSRFGEIPELPATDPDSAPDSGASHKTKELEAEADAAPRKRGASAAAMQNVPTLGKRRRRRPSGIVTWDSADVEAAEEIERTHDRSAIQAAIDAVLSRIKKDPVPGLVLQELERMERSRTLDAQRAADAGRRQAAQSAAVDQAQMASDYINALDADEHAALLREFLDHASRHNRPILTKFRSDGLASKLVSAALAAYVREQRLHLPLSAAAHTYHHIDTTP